MGDLVERQQSRRWFPELWTDLLTGFPSSFTGLHPGNLIKLEDTMENGRYVLRAELPGLTPDKDVEVTVRDGRLTIKAERSERTKANGRSEFSYGSFTRSVTLPPGADEDDIKASYDKGILTVSVGVPEPAAAAEKHIAVKTTD